MELVRFCPLECDENRKSAAAAAARVVQDPTATLHDISSAKPDLFLLQAVVNASSTIPRIWRGGAPALYIKYIVDGYECRAIAEPHWKMPLMGITNVLTGISAAKSRDRDSAILAKLREAYPSIRAVIWHDLDKLLIPDPQADILRGIVCRYMKEMAITASHQRCMYDETTVALGMHCWLNMSINRDNRQYAVDFIHHFFGHLPEDAPSDILDQAVEVVTVDAIIIRIKEALSDPNMIDGAIEDECCALKSFVLADRSWSKAFITARIYDSVARALQRQLKTGSPQYAWDVLHPGYHLLHAFIEISPTPRALVVEDLLVNTPALEVAAQGLIVARQNDSDDWIRLFNDVSSTARCTNPDCEERVSPKFMIGCQSKLERLYIPTRDILRNDSGADSEALKAWNRFADSVGVSESLLIAKWIREVQCCNPHCVIRSAKTKAADLMKCAGCQSVFYHGRPCQKADWKRHKRQCQRSAE